MSEVLEREKEVAREEGGVFCCAGAGVGMLFAGGVVKAGQRVTNLVHQIEREGGFDCECGLEQLLIEALRPQAHQRDVLKI